MSKQKKRIINGLHLMMQMEQDFENMKKSNDYLEVVKFCKKWNVTWKEV